MKVEQTVRGQGTHR
uniref:Uncharacterized protein n=1 Tax=Anguilla anguilla TaxID=7936 RepID=A0A0E9S5N9_ANGAN